MKFFASLILIAFGIFTSLAVYGQAPEVPHKMQFADITLSIRDDARREIQKDVDAMTLSPKHFNIKAERAKTYFPIIEKVFAEENVPDDFKYLVLQESALIADAVSPSNAVGFWQFKDFTAIEMGLRVDKEIDERMNIVSASRGAAKYFKKNNMFFDNWLYALQAYQMGAGAVMQIVKDNEHSVKHMEVTSKTYWYVKKFLAHKIAFENAVKGPGQVQVATFESKGKRAVADLAKEISIEEAVLRSNNKWIKKDAIPDDRTYAVLIPVSGNINDIKVPSSLPVTVASNTRVVAPNAGRAAKINKINGLSVIVAISGETPTMLAARGGVELSEFLRWNEISISDPVKEGQVYFLAKKRTRATEAYHNVKPGEDLWMISQRYGVQLKKLRKYNRLESNFVTAGETLWLSAKRPKDADHLKESTSVAEVNNAETFNWADEQPAPVVASTKVIEVPLTVSEPVREENEPIKKDEALKEQPVLDSLEKIETEKQKLLESEMMQAVKDTSSIKVTVPTDAAAANEIKVTPKSDKTEHIVQPKETLYGIANLYHIGVMDLVNWNGLNIQDGIKPGQHLKLFGDEQAEEQERSVEKSEEIFHEVKTTDTLYSIARKYGVTIKDLMEWNGKNDFNLTVGEKLKILKP
jgi:membrane-bound lytic murein transglycosylase D